MIDNLSETAKELIEQVNAEADLIKSIGDLAEEAYIPQGIEIPKPETVFGMDGIPVFTKKSLSTLIGKAKSGKTTCTAWIVAQTIQQELSVLWIDTEQGQYYASRTQHWVLHISGTPTSPFLKFYDLKIHNPIVRTKIIESLVDQHHPDIVIIDGVRDLVFDINNAEEATIISGLLMKIADINNCHILSIIHQNKGNEHARGHLGTEMVNKSECVIKVTKDDKGLTVCEPEFTRGEPFPIFAFDRDSYGLPVMVNYVAKISGGESNAKKTLPIDIDQSTHQECLKKAFGAFETLPYAELIPAVSAAFEYFGMAMGVVKTKSFIQFYTQNGYLNSEKTGTKTRYSLRNVDTKKLNISTIQPNISYDKIGEIELSQATLDDLYNDDEPPF